MYDFVSFLYDFIHSLLTDSCLNQAVVYLPPFTLHPSPADYQHKSGETYTMDFL